MLVRPDAVSSGRIGTLVDGRREGSWPRHWQDRPPALLEDAVALGGAFLIIMARETA